MKVRNCGLLPGRAQPSLLSSAEQRLGRSLPHTLSLAEAKNEQSVTPQIRLYGVRRDKCNFTSVKKVNLY